MLDFRRITLFCLEKRLSKHKMTIVSKNFGEGHGPSGPPGPWPGFKVGGAKYMFRGKDLYFYYTGTFKQTFLGNKKIREHCTRMSPPTVPVCLPYGYEPAASNIQYIACNT